MNDFDIFELAEDVYYVTRDHGQVYGLNSLACYPAELTATELEIIQNLAHAADQAVGMVKTYTAMPPRTRGPWENLIGQPFGLYYADGRGRLWALSDDDQRPDLGTRDIAVVRALLTTARRNLDRLTQEVR